LIVYDSMEWMRDQGVPSGMKYPLTPQMLQLIFESGHWRDARDMAEGVPFGPRPEEGVERDYPRLLEHDRRRHSHDSRRSKKKKSHSRRKRSSKRSKARHKHKKKSRHPHDSKPTHKSKRRGRGRHSHDQRERHKKKQKKTAHSVLLGKKKRYNPDDYESYDFSKRTI